MARRVFHVNVYPRSCDTDLSIGDGTFKCVPAEFRCILRVLSILSSLRCDHYHNMIPTNRSASRHLPNALVRLTGVTGSSSRVRASRPTAPAAKTATRNIQSQARIPNSTLSTSWSTSRRTYASEAVGKPSGILY